MARGKGRMGGSLSLSWKSIRVQTSVKTITSLPVVMLLFLQPGCRQAPLSITPERSPALSISLQPGATLALRTAQEIDSSSSSPGQIFAAVVSRDINNTTGQTVLPSGSPVKLILLRVQQTSAKGKVFELRLASMTLNGDIFGTQRIAGR